MKVYDSIKDDTTYLLSEQETDEDAEYILMFVNGADAYELYHGCCVGFHKKEEEKTIILTKELLEG